MKISKKGMDLIKTFESLHDGDKSMPGLQPQMDPAGIWTEGYGRAMRDSKGNFLRGIANKELAYCKSTIKTPQDADKAFQEDLRPREHIVMQKIKVPLNQNQFDALVSYVYNTGGSSTLYGLINSKASDKEIRSWFENHYITSGGIKYNGLVRRRKAEADLYFTR